MSFPRHFARATGVSPRNDRQRREDRAIREHGIRTPYRVVKAVRIGTLEEDGAWMEGEEIGVLSCGHDAQGRGSREIGKRMPCYACKDALVQAAIRADAADKARELSRMIP